MKTKNKVLLSLVLAILLGGMFFLRDTLSFKGLKSLAINTTSAAREFRISPNLSTSGDNFASLDAFMRRSNPCINPGDKILFERGQEYRGTFGITSCDETSGGTVEVSAYGDRAQPLPKIVASINAQEKGLGWTRVEEALIEGKTIPDRDKLAIYKMGPFSSPVRQMHIGGTRQQIAVYPDVDNTSGAPTFLTVQTSSDSCGGPDDWCGEPPLPHETTVILSPDTSLDYQNANSFLNNAAHADGLQAVVRASAWNYEVSGITSVQGGTEIVMADVLRKAPSGMRLLKRGSGMYFRGSVLLLSTPGEWASVKKRNNEYYVYYVGQRSETPLPPNTEIAPLASNTEITLSETSRQYPAAKPNTGFYARLNDQTDLLIKNISVLNASDTGMSIDVTKHLVIDGVEISSTEGSGLSVSNSATERDITIQNSRFINNAGNGIGRPSTEGAITISNNTLQKNGFLANQAVFGFPHLVGINIGASNHTKIENNTIIDSGYSAINSNNNGENPFEISNNTIKGFCKWANDCGGIYIAGQNDINTGDTTPSFFKRIHNNTIEDGIGFTPGHTFNPMASAIYLDKGTSGFELTDNRISNTRSDIGAININSGNWNIIRGNTIHTAEGAAIRVGYSGTAACTSSNGEPRPTGKNQIVNNTITSTTDETKRINLQDKISNDPSALVSDLSGNTGGIIREMGVPPNQRNDCSDNRAAPYTYSISYRGNGSTSGTITTPPNPYPAGTAITVKGPGSLKKTGYTFVGWNTAPSGTGTNYAVGATLTLESNVILYAKWRLTPGTPVATYPVTYNANGAAGIAPGNQIKRQNIDLILANNTRSLFKAGYTFTGWNTAADGTGTSYALGETYIFNAPVILYAKWRANNNTITFDKNDADATGTMEPQTFATGTSANLTSNNFQKVGYKFVGWTRTPTGSTTVYPDRANYTMGTVNNITLYAQWRRINRVTFYSPDYTIPPDPRIISVIPPRTTIPYLPSNPSRRGYSFGGWYTAVNGGGTQFTATTNVNADIGVYAQWIPVPSPTNLTTTCSSDGRTLTARWKRAGGYPYINFRISPSSAWDPSTKIWSDMRLWKHNIEVDTTQVTIEPGVQYMVWLHTKSGYDVSHPPVAVNVTCRDNPRSTQ